MAFFAAGCVEPGGFRSMGEGVSWGCGGGRKRGGRGERKEEDEVAWRRRGRNILFIDLGFFVLVDCVAEAFPEVWVAGDCHFCVSFLLTAPAIDYVVLTA